MNQFSLGGLWQNIHSELGELLAAPPSIWKGGVEVDHYRGLARDLAQRLLPFVGAEQYDPTEFLFGFVPLRDRALSRLYFQIAVLAVKDNDVPGVGQFASVVRAPIAETYITPLVGLTWRPLPLAPLVQDEVRPKHLYQNKTNWNPFLEAVNSDKATLKAIESPRHFAGMGKYEVKLGRSRLGTVQLAPFKGNTIITLQTAPSPEAAVNRPYYELRRHLYAMQMLAAHVIRHPTKGVEIGTQIVTRANAAMMELVLAELEQQSPAASGPGG